MAVVAETATVTTTSGRGRAARRPSLTVRTVCGEREGGESTTGGACIVRGRDECRGACIVGCPPEAVKFLAFFLRSGEIFVPFTPVKSVKFPTRITGQLRDYARVPRLVRSDAVNERRNVVDAHTPHQIYVYLA